MTANTHSIQLKIDAAAAETGAKKFQAAINAIKQAVSGLERDTNGLFTTLNKISPKIDTSAIKAATTETSRLAGATASADVAATQMGVKIQRTALAAATALRVSENAAQRLN